MFKRKPAPKKVLPATKRRIPCKHSGGEIRLIEFQGKNGGFAIKEQTMWTVKLFGLNKEQVDLFDIDGGPHGTTMKTDARRVAQTWSALTGWPIVEYKEATTVTKALRKVTG